MIENKPITQTPRVSPANNAVHATRSAQTNPPMQPFNKSTFFTKDNYIWMLAGLAVIILGMLLMIGGKSNDPSVFDQKEVYSTTRITIAPLLIVIGLALEVYAIFKKPKPKI
ncbi:MAG: DUF3098 domain-containing protein [Chitinophagaceae bacterium]